MRAVIAVGVLAACGSGPSGPALTFDPCQPVVLAAPSVTAEQRASIDDAIGLWSAAGVTAFSLGEAPQITLEYKDAAAALYGFYDDTTATVYVNADISDPGQRAIVIAHELGHAIGLQHVPVTTRPSVMNPGNLTVEPTAGDVTALAALWGSCVP